MHPLHVDHFLRFSYLIWVRHAQQSARRRGQYVPKAKIDHAEMRIFGIGWSYIPGGASQIGILNVRLQCAIPWVLPESLKPIEAHLLNSPVVCMGRAGPAKSDNCSGMRGVRG